MFGGSLGGTILFGMISLAPYRNGFSDPAGRNF
jgi:hypothetical protein